MAYTRLIRAEAARGINAAGVYRRLGSSMNKRPDERASYFAQARKIMRLAIIDRTDAQAAGFKLP